MNALHVARWTLVLVILFAPQRASAQPAATGAVSRAQDASVTALQRAAPRLATYARRELHALRLRTLPAPPSTRGSALPEQGAPAALVPDRPAPASLLPPVGGTPAGTRPVTEGIVMAELLVGVLVGAAASGAFAYAGAATIGSGGGEGSGLMGAAAGFVAGATVGSSLGVYGVGCMRDGRGAFAGSFLGSALGMGVFMLLGPDPDDTPLFLAGAYGLPALGATIGFNLSRR